jgi:hypothetical protein
MKRELWMVVAGVTALSAGSSYAQKQQGSQAAPTEKKIYRWVDKNGKVQYSETLPADAKDQARQEFDASGNSTGSVARALTEEERIALAEKRAIDAKIAEKEAAKKRFDDAMMAVFENEQDLLRNFDERIDLAKQSIESTEVGIKSQRETLISLLSEASENELKGRPTDPKRLSSIKELHVELIKQKVRLEEYKADFAGLGTERDAALARYRELRGLQEQRNAKPGAASTPAAPSN